MKKKLDTRFPAARIKKIMQADDEVGKIAMATPVLISKALELFLQDLCDRTYDITLKKGAKTMSSHHLKECVQTHSVFDFLRETVSRVPELEAESAGGGDNGRRRKAIDGDNDESCEEDSKRSRSEVQAAPSRGRGRGRGRGRKRNSDKARIGESSEKPEDNEALSSPQLTDDECEMSPKSQVDEGQSSGAAKDSITSNSQCPLKGFDLNMGLDENGEVPATETESEPHQSEWLGAGFPGMDPSTLHQDQSGFLQEEDYDCEDED